MRKDALDVGGAATAHLRQNIDTRFYTRASEAPESKARGQHLIKAMLDCIFRPFASTKENTHPYLERCCDMGGRGIRTTGGGSAQVPHHTNPFRNHSVATRR